MTRPPLPTPTLARVDPTVTRAGRVILQDRPDELCEIRLVVPAPPGRGAAWRALVVEALAATAAPLGTALAVTSRVDSLRIAVTAPPGAVPASIDWLRRLLDTPLDLEVHLAQLRPETSTQAEFDAMLACAGRGDPATSTLVTAAELDTLTTANAGASWAEAAGAGRLIAVGFPELVEAAVDGADWPADPVPARQPAADSGARFPVAVERDLPQTHLGLAGPAPERDAPDAAAFAVAVRLVGGTASARLARRLREELGWAYYALAAWQPAASGPAIAVRTAVAAERAAPALAELAGVLAGLGTAALEEAEVAAARNGLLGRLTIETHTGAGLAEHLGDRVAEGSSVTAMRDLAERAREVSAEEVVAAAGTWLRPERLVSVAVGATAGLPGVSAP